MANYELEITGDNPLDQIELQIAAEEASSSEFVKSEIRTIDNKLANVVTFKELAPGIITKRAKLTFDTDSAVPNHTEKWRGPMIVLGSNRMVLLWRPQ